MTDYHFINIHANEGLSLAAIEFAILPGNIPNPKSFMFYITPDKQGWTDPYDGQHGAGLQFSDGTIIVRYKRHGISRILKILSGQGSDNPEETTIETSAT